MDPRTASGKTSAKSVYIKFTLFFLLFGFVISGMIGADPGLSVFLSLCAVGGGLLTVWAIMTLANVGFDTVFSDPASQEWRKQGGNPAIDAMGFPLNNQSREERAATGALMCAKCRTRLVENVSHGMIVNQCPECGLVWCDGQWWQLPPE
jgi:hypothetical protein